MNIALFAAAGSFAAEVVRCLEEEGHNIRTIYLESSAARGETGSSRNSQASAIRKALLRAESILYLSRAAAATDALWQQVRDCVLPLADVLSLAAEAPVKIERVVVVSPATLYGEGSYLCPVNGTVTAQWRRDDDLRRQDWEHRCPICNEQLLPAATRENHALAPLSVSGVLAYLQERLAMNWALNRRIPVVAMRYFEMYGDGTHRAAEQLIEYAIKGLPLNIPEDAGQSRDYISLQDVARAVPVGVQAPCEGSLVLNVASGIQVSVRDFVGCLEKILGKELPIRCSGTFDRNDPRHLYADISAVGRAGYRPRVALCEGLEQYVGKLLEEGPKASRGRKS